MGRKSEARFGLTFRVIAAKFLQGDPFPRTQSCLKG